MRRWNDCVVVRTLVQHKLTLLAHKTKNIKRMNKGFLWLVLTLFLLVYVVTLC